MRFSTLMGLMIEDDDLRWKMACIQNDGKEKADEEPEAEYCAMTGKVTPMTPLYVHVVLPSPMPMTFIHAQRCSGGYKTMFVYY